MRTDPTILILAGEESGDLHGAPVARALLERWPQARLIGMGGAAMRAAGVELLAELSDLAVMGFVEVARRLPFFLRLERRVRAVMREEGVDLVLPIDYPGFNLRMSRAARELGIPVLYYIAPQVWAWKKRRAERLARDTDQVAVVLPFEVEFLERFGAHATFVGHPLIEHGPSLPERQVWARSAGLDPRRPVLALFPGSRRQELERHLDLFIESGRLLVAQHPELQVAIARAPALSIGQLPAGTVALEDPAALLAHAHLALVKSGTSTLQAALAGTPFVCAYRTHPLTFALAERLVKIDTIALANLVAEERVVPEILQKQATPSRLRDELELLYAEDSATRQRQLVGFARIRNRLGTPGAAHRVAELAAQILAGCGE